MEQTIRLLFVLCLLVPGISVSVHAQNRQTVRVGVYHNPPKISVSEDGVVGGFHAELIEAIADVNEWDVEYVAGPWTDMLDATEAGEIDVMVDVAWSEERMVRFAFNSEAVILNWAVVYTGPGFRPQSFLDLEGRTIALMEESIHTTGQTGFSGLAESLGIGFSARMVPDYTEAFSAVSRGDADGAVVNRIFGTEFSESFGLIRSPIIFNASSIRYAFPLGGTLTTNLIEQIDQTLRELKADSASVYYDLIDRYFSDLVTERALVPPWLVALAASLAGVAFTMLLLISRLRAEVRIRRQMEATLVETARDAERANQAKSRFLANMTHEIRTPMNAIIGYSDLLQRDAGLSPKQRHALESINRSGEHLLALINDVLDMARIESGKLSLELSSFDLNTTVTDAIHVVHAIGEKAGVQIRSVLPADEQVFVRSDEPKIRQIIINLVTNAIRHSGSAVVEVSMRIHQDASRQCEIIVRDYGVGVNGEKQEAIFQSFASGDNQHSAGAGLGLAISRTYARALDGDITIQSPLSDGSSGTEFNFSFRYEAAEEPERLGRVPSDKRIRMLDPSQPPVSVLVVDDRETNRDILHELLEPIGFSVRSVDSGEACIGLLENWVPKLILMDIVMEGMDGVSAVKAIRKLPPPAGSVRIIALTASALLGERSRILQAGADAFMFKPIREQKLLRAIGELLELTYIYEDQAITPSSAGTLSDESIPRDIAAKLAAAARLGSRRDVERILDESDLSETVKTKLSSCAREFRFQDLVQMVEEGA